MTRSKNGIGELREHLKDADPPGTSRRERRLLAIIDAELAKLDDTPRPTRAPAIVQEAQRQVAAEPEHIVDIAAAGARVIIVEKPITRAPADWVAASEAERREVIRRFRGQPRTAVVKFKYKAYGLDPLRKALNEIFFFKCAYCESPVGPTQPVAIEH